ncbi:YfhO family protein [Patescibacteria group bacterium]|nr:YfhO family protein [Patescibacteria group bacterium]MCL5091279.1 YfhO family protein [Patescibacteria group bacterium]
MRQAIARSHLGALIVVGVVLLTFFHRVIFQANLFLPGDFLRSDTLHQNLPFKFVLSQALQHNTLPFWTNEIGMGFPLLAEGQTGVLYPVNLILFRFLPFALAYNWALFSSFVIAAAGMYVLIGAFSLGRGARIFAALVFSLSSFFVLHITHQNIIAAAGWVPWLWWSLRKMAGNRQRHYRWFTVAIITLQWLTGAFQITVYSIVVGLIFLLLQTLENKARWRLMACYGVCVTVATLLAMPQLLPTLQLAGQSLRSQGLGTIALESLPYHPRNLIGFILPYAFGDPGLGTYPRFGGSWGMFWENTAYIGIVPLILVAVALAIGKTRRLVLRLAALAGISLGLALGKFGPLFWFFYLPVVNDFRVSARFLIFVIAAAVVIASYGYSWLLGRCKRRGIRLVVAAALIIISLLDLFQFGYDYNPVAPAKAVLAVPETAAFLRSRLRPGERIMTIDASLDYDQINQSGWRHNLNANLDHRNDLDPDVNLLWGISNSSSYSGLELSGNAVWEGMIDQGLQRGKNGVGVATSALKLLGLANVRYLVSHDRLVNDRLKLVFQTSKAPGYQIYANDWAVGAGVLIKTAVHLNSPTNLATLADGDTAPTQTLFLETDLISPLVASSAANGQPGAVRLLSATPQRWSFAVNAAQPQWLLVQNTDYPGWQATVNGKPTLIYRADGLFQTVMVPAGRSTVQFSYRCDRFVIGIIIAVLTLIVGSVYVLWPWIADRVNSVF